MRILMAALIMILVATGPGAEAEDHVVIKPGIMCRSSTALATLTLPGGDSRTHRLPPNDRDLATAGTGGCEDLSIGRTLNVVKAFRNTAIVTLDDDRQIGSTTFYIAPIIDLAPASVPHPKPTAALSPERILGHDDRMSETNLTNLIGQDEDAFIKTHPQGECSKPEPGVERCIYRTVDRRSCPIGFGCSNVIYEFRNGRLTSFQTSFLLEEDWKAADRLALKRYPVLKRVRTVAAESTFFKTGRGILGFGRTFMQTNELSPVWELRFPLAEADTEVE